MEKKLNTIIQDYVTEFKNSVRDKITNMNFDEKDRQKVLELLEHVNEYDRLALKPEDLNKRKRIKNSIPILNRCTALRANGQRCTRRHKEDTEFCGTHIKGIPHGLYSEQNEVLPQMQKVEVFAEDIKGIIYYIDRFNNVYATEDILASKENPRIIAKSVKVGNNVSIPSLGI